MRLRTSLIIIGILANLYLSAQDTLCKREDLGKIQFKKNSTKLTLSAKAKLDSLIPIINNKPTCEFLVTSYYPDLCDKCGALSWRRQKSIIDYLIKKGISEKRLRTFSEFAGSTDFVYFTFTSWPLTDEPPPHPNLKFKKE